MRMPSPIGLGDLGKFSTYRGRLWGFKDFLTLPVSSLLPCLQVKMYIFSCSTLPCLLHHSGSSLHISGKPVKGCRLSCSQIVYSFDLSLSYPPTPFHSTSKMFSTVPLVGLCSYERPLCPTNALFHTSHHRKAYLSQSCILLQEHVNETGTPEQVRGTC